jgi:hypothetical protein
MVLMAASILFNSGAAIANNNTSPVLDSVEEFQFSAIEVREQRFIQLRVNDLLNVLEASTNKNVIYDLENEPAYTIERAADGSLDIIHNMGIALTSSKAAGISNVLEFHSGIEGTAWQKFSELTEKASKLLTPKSLIRFDANKVPHAVSKIDFEFKLWDMSNRGAVDVKKPQDTTSNLNDSPFSKDTQVVYVKVPWLSVDN